MLSHDVPVIYSNKNKKGGVDILVTLQAKYLENSALKKNNKQISQQCIENVKPFHLIC